MLRPFLPALMLVPVLLTACDTSTYPVASTGTDIVPVAPAGPPLDPQAAAANFRTVVARVEPVAESLCRARNSGNCDIQIAIDSRAGQPANAYQTLDANGRPVVAFTLALIADARNIDELAFVMGHEAAHHILDHIPRQQTSTALGGLAGGLIATALGSGDETVRAAQDIGATLGARGYSKDHELEADSLGAEIALRAGFDPVRGAAFFTRLPDPGDRFLGTHPANAQRIATVRAAVARLR